MSNHAMTGLLITVIVFTVPVIFILSLTLPLAIRERSWKHFGIVLGQVFAGVFLPLLAFFASSLLVPNSKNECHHRWWHCFLVTKITLAPFLVWAVSALYVHDIKRSETRHRAWVTTGLFVGFLTTALLTAFLFTLGGRGLISLFNLPWPLIPLSLTPFYMTFWGGWRAFQLWKQGLLRAGTCALWSLLSIPFWIGGLLWSRKLYESLPESSGCFVVTAAMNGHEAVVGKSKRQLMVFREFEAAWRSRDPGSHAAFRLAYNRVGPVIARRIRSPWTADAVCLALKPLEWLAGRITEKNATGGDRRLHD